MPILQFECAQGHVTDKLVAARDVDGARSIACPGCTIALAHRILSPTATTFRHADAKAFKG